MLTPFSKLSRFGLIVSIILLAGSAMLAVSLISFISRGTLEESQSMHAYAPDFVRGSAMSPAAPSTMDAVAGREMAAKAMPADRGTLAFPAPVPSNTFIPGVNRAIVKTGYLDLVVDSPRQTVDQITQYVTSAQGVVIDTNISSDEFGDGATRATLTVRVPASGFDGALKTMRGFSQKILRDQVMSDDRTAQKVDLEATLKNLRAAEEQLLAILKQAKTVSDTLEVQRELTSTRTQIEQLSAQLENLNNEVEYSTIYVTLISSSAELPVVGPSEPSFKEELKLSLRYMVRWYRAAAISLIRFAMIVMPIIVVLGLFVMVSKKVRGRK